MTLAFHGKSRSRAALLLTFASVAVFGAIIAGAALRTPKVASATVTVPLNSSHVGATNPGFGTGSCPTPPAGKAGWYGWHFVMPSNANFTSLTVTFQNAGTFSANPYPGSVFVASPDNSHAYIWTPGPDTLLSGSATVAGESGPDKFNLSHVCTGTATPTNTPVTPSNTPVTPTNTPVTPSVTTISQTQVLATATNTNTPVPPTNTPVNTPTNTPIPPTPTNTVTGSNPVAPTNTPTNTAISVATSQNPVTNPSPSISINQGARTPGPTPQAPATGSGAPGGEGMNLLAAIAGLFAVSAGLAAVATSRRRR